MRRLRWTAWLRLALKQKGTSLAGWRDWNGRVRGTALREGGAGGGGKGWCEGGLAGFQVAKETILQVAAGIKVGS